MRKKKGLMSQYSGMSAMSAVSRASSHQSSQVAPSESISQVTTQSKLKTLKDELSKERDQRKKLEDIVKRLQNLKTGGS
jgi:predicted  nucleic acid-binding Zn-ribbon protein